MDIQVSLGERSYPIKIASDLLKTQPLSPYIQGKQALVVTNKTIAKWYLPPLLEKLKNEGVNAQSFQLEDGERFKSLETLNSIFDFLLTNKLSRNVTLIALGGGVVGDITGFAAACYQRGVPFIQIPTTLLAQVDSSVGGKTAVNHQLGKNMIGAFYQPKAVFIDTNTLKTLPAREFSAGLAEVIKYGLISDHDFLVWLEQSIDALIDRDSQAIAQAVAVSCQAKAKVVAADETEQGIRAILNLGHTFGHAVEAAQQYKGWLHGEAVGAGMCMAAKLSQELGLLSEQDYQRTKQLIERANLPTWAPDTVSAEEMLQHMGVDKKALNGTLRLVLLQSLGKAFVTSNFPQSTLMGVLQRNEG